MKRQPAPGMRICRACEDEKPIDDFYMHGNGTSRLTRCKTCHNRRCLEDQRKRRERDPETWRARYQVYYRRYYLKHRERLLPKRRAQMKIWRRKRREQADANKG